MLQLTIYMYVFRQSLHTCSKISMVKAGLGPDHFTLPWDKQTLNWESMKVFWEHDTLTPFLTGQFLLVKAKDSSYTER